VGGPLAGLLLQIHWFGLAGWRWLSIVEATPALVFSVLVWFLLPDRPTNASWLSANERCWLEARLKEECQFRLERNRIKAAQVFRQPIVIALCSIIFLANIGIQGFFLWLPTTVQRAAGLSASAASSLSGIPFLVAVASVYVCSWSSDHSQKRALHIFAPLLLSGLIFPITALTRLSFGWLLFWLCASSAAIYGFGPSFYLVPSLILNESAAAAAVGLINMFAGLGGFAGPAVAGRMLQMGYPFPLVIKFLSACFFLAGLLCFGIRNKLTPPKMQGVV
jgi:ACS family tartrate transporter-like MFS transporter